MIAVGVAAAVTADRAAGATVSVPVVGMISMAETFAFSLRVMKSIVTAPSEMVTGNSSTIARSIPPAWDQMS